MTCWGILNEHKIKTYQQNVFKKKVLSSILLSHSLIKEVGCMRFLWICKDHYIINEFTLLVCLQIVMNQIIVSYLVHHSEH